jgi:hypothetical protein
MGIAFAEEMIDTEKGRVPLRALAEISSEVSPAGVNRENGERKLVVSGNASGRDMRSVVEDIRKRIGEKVALPEGYRIELGGQFESEEKAGKRLLLASAMSLLVIFLLLYGEYKSVRESGMILLNLPLALMGGVFMLYVTGGALSIPAIIGFISLLGIATRNGMLLVSRYRQLEEEGYGVEEAIRRGSSERLTAILMTALSSALALVPLAMRGDLPGNEIQSPMAIVILGGLLTSTLLNGFIVPAVYGWVKKGMVAVIVLLAAVSMPVEAQVEVVGELAWPGVYMAKGEMLRLQNQGVELAKGEMEQEARVMIGELEVEVEYNEKRLERLEGRLEVLERLFAGYGRALESGEVGGIEVGRLAMEVRRLQAEKYVLKAEIERGKVELEKLREKYGAGPQQVEERRGDMRLWVAENEWEKARVGVVLARREGLPGVEIGRAVNVWEKGIGNKGVEIGVRVPLWGNRQRVREAVLTAKAAEVRYEWAQMRVEGEKVGLYSKAEELRQSVEMYKEALEAGRGVEEKLLKGVEGGVMRMGEYLLMSGEVYEMEMRRLEVEMEYYKTLARLRRFRR